jgi:hypothetical protein
MLNIVGEAGELCDRPMFILDVVLTVSPTHTNCVRSLRKDDKKSFSAPDTFMRSISCANIPWSSISKALEKSTKRQQTKKFLSIDFFTYSISLAHADKVFDFGTNPY